MNVFEGQSSVYPYRNPAYWDGYEVGVDPVSCGEYIPFDHARFAKDALTRKLGLMYDGYRPLERLRSGQEFEPSEHPPGTVVRFRREE